METLVSTSTTVSSVEQSGLFLPLQCSSTTVSSGNKFKSVNADEVACLNVFYCNARSIKNKLELLYDIIYHRKYDIICISETWLGIDFSDGLLDPEGVFNIYRTDRDSNFACGGVLILVNKRLSSFPVACDDSSLETIEIVACNIKCGKDCCFIIACVYISPNIKFEQLIKAIAVFETLCGRAIRCILIGDFNLPGINWAKDQVPNIPKNQAFYDFCMDFGFIQLINEATRGHNILDLLLVNDQRFISNWEVSEPLGASDHAAIEFSLIFDLTLKGYRRPNNVQNSLNGTCMFDDNETSKSWHKADWDSMVFFCQSINWVELFLYCIDADMIWYVFKSVMSQCVYNYVPNKRITTKAIRTHSMNVRKLLIKKKKCWKMKKCVNSDMQNLNYRAICDEVRNELLYEAREREHEVINSGNVGAFFNHVNKRMSHKSDISPLINGEGVYETSDFARAELLGDYFAQVRVVDNGLFPPFETSQIFNNAVSLEHVIEDDSVQEVTKLQTCNNRYINNDLSADMEYSQDYSNIRPNKNECMLDLTNGGNTLSTVYFEISEVVSTITKLRAGAAPGPDGLSPLIFKKLMFQISPALAIMFNLIIQFGSIPKEWATAIVVPVFKKGVPSKPENYRPISLTCVGCKIFESIIKKHLLAFLWNNKILSPNQHGFLSKRSTCTNLLECLNDWTGALNESKDTAVLYVDFARAFDSVSIPKLIFKLDQLGIRNKLLQCISSFLTGRSQRVKVGDSFSSYKTLISGVPQGSVLGPICFLIFVNDLFSNLPKCATSKLFADDLKSYLTYSRTDLQSTSNNLSTLLTAISDWANKWQLPISAQKTNWMLISNRPNTNAISLVLDGTELPCVNETKDLGILFTSCLSFSDHIQGCVSRARQRIYLLRKCFTCSDDRSLILAYKSYVLPILEYCSPVWSPCNVSDIIKLEAVQRRFTRYLPACYRKNYNYNERLIVCGLMSLEKRRLISDLILLYKIINHETLINLGDSLEIHRGKCTRGNSLRITIKTARLNKRLHFFTNRTARVWNLLPDFIVCADSVKMFRTCLLSTDLSKYLVFP